jgi:hypothetical protein
MSDNRRITPWLTPARACVVLTLSLAPALLGRPVALAEPPADVSKAADAFSRAQEAERRGDWAEAANLYGLADEIAPTPEALRSAARASLKAGMSARAATHASTLLSRESEDPQSRAVGEDILRATEGELTRIEARCTIACRVLIDGQLATARAATAHVLYARPGARQLSASFETEPAAPEQALELQAGQTIRPHFAPGSAALASVDAAAGEPAAEERGISPWIFGSGVVLSAALGAVSVWSGMQVKSAHADYDRAAADAQSQFEHGQKLELRTNVLFGVTAAVGLGTLLTAFYTEWGAHSDDKPTARARVTPQLAAGKHGLLVGVSAPLSW